MRFAAVLVTALALSSAATAQLPRVALPGALAPGIEVPSLTGLGDTVGRLADPRALADDRRLRLRDLVRAHPRDLDRDPRGEPVIRDELLAVAPSPEALAVTQAAGFRVLRSETLDGLDLSITVLAPPPRMEAVRGR